MTQPHSEIDTLAGRLEKGFTMLRQAEDRRRKGRPADYEKWLYHFEGLLLEYQSRCLQAEQMSLEAPDGTRIFFTPADWSRDQVRECISLLIEDSGWEERSVTDSYGVMATAQDAEAWVRKTASRYNATAVARHTDGWVIGQSVQMGLEVAS